MTYRITQAGEDMPGMIRRARKQWRCFMCKRDINPGDRYFDEHSSSHTYESGYPHCLRCAAEQGWVVEVAP